MTAVIEKHDNALLSEVNIRSFTNTPIKKSNTVK